MDKWILLSTTREASTEFGTLRMVSLRVAGVTEIDEIRDVIVLLWSFSDLVVMDVCAHRSVCYFWIDGYVETAVGAPSVVLSADIFFDGAIRHNQQHRSLRSESHDSRDLLIGHAAEFQCDGLYLARA